MTRGRTSIVTSGTLSLTLAGYFLLGTATPHLRQVTTLGRAGDQVRGSSASDASQAGQRQYRKPAWTGTRAARALASFLSRSLTPGSAQKRVCHDSGSSN